MEVLFAASVAISVILAILAHSALKLHQRLWIRPKKLEKQLKELGFKGNPYRFLHGDMKEYFSIAQAANSKPINFSHDIGARLLPYEHRIVEKHGKNSFVWFGAKPRLNIMDPMLVKEILFKHEEFHKVYPDPIADLVVGGLSTTHAETWTRRRKILNVAFNVEKLKGTLPVLYLSCKDTVSKWKGLVSAGTTEIDVWPYIEILARDMISRAAFGSFYEEGRRIFQLHDMQADLAFQVMVSSYIPWSRHFKFGANKKMKELNKEMTGQLTRIIKKREKALKMGQKVNTDDLLSVLMDATKKDIQEGSGMSMEEVIDECKLFYSAGADSTARLLVWTIVCLSKHGDWQSRAREEVFQVMGDKDIDCEKLNQLKIITMILNEVLRLYPPSALLLRATSKKMKLGNLTIPAWVHLTMPVIFHNHDSEIWGEDAKEFNPQRLSEGISNATKGSPVFIPFSWGPRTCIGQHLVLIEARIAIAMILQSFSLELSPSYLHAPELTFLLKPQYGAKIILQEL
ncbi:cytochrome P450 CYP72A219-like [Daucus carota subsp. sativus]|uniref:cytochrome P450 CYP72A219-like n=1 Tax=Daucus carota subsp. sativus TaxID=79200 RepID=UPI0030838DFA